MSAEFNPQSYASLPLTDAPGLIALVTEVLAKAPAAPTLAGATTRLRDALVKLQAAWEASQQADPANATRAAHGELDAAYSHLFARLEAYANLPVERYPRAARAAELLTALFPDGLAFTHRPYREEWATSAALLTRVDGQGLQPDLDALAGPEFLAEVRAAHTAYGDALGLTRNTVTVAVDVATPFDALKADLARYVRAVVVLADDGTAASVALARAALAPIDAHRAATHARKAASKPRKDPASNPAQPVAGKS